MLDRLSKNKECHSAVLMARRLTACLPDWVSTMNGQVQKERPLNSIDFIIQIQ
jgi:hypothetical protein